MCQTPFEMSQVDDITQQAMSLSSRDLYRLHRAIGDMIGRRVYYQLHVKTPEHKEGLVYDPTDRLEEVLEQLARIVVSNVQHKAMSLPKSMFTRHGDVITGVKEEFMDEQNMHNIFETFLGSGFSYWIDTFEMST